MALAIWTFIVLVFIVITVLCLALIGLFSSSDGGDCNCFGNCELSQCENCLCCGNESCGSCGDVFFLETIAQDDVLFGGPRPARTGCGACCCSTSGNCRACFVPMKWFEYNFPHLPDNLWGGLFGLFCLGTHSLSSRPYQGGSAFIDFLSFRNRRDLRPYDQWRSEVRAFLGIDAITGSHVPPQQQMRVHIGREGVIAESVAKNFKIGGVTICSTRHHFSSSDNCVEQSLSDYENRFCWICMSAGCESWDLWLLCGHLFCSQCSEEMIVRKMPCPLCRKVSPTVKRAPVKYQKPSSSHSPSDQ